MWGRHTLPGPTRLGSKSLGYWFFHQGMSYMFEPGSIDWGFGTTGFGFDTPFGVLITYIFPLIVVFVALLAPEIVGLSRVTRAGFVAFGSFIVALSALFVLTWTLPARSVRGCPGLHGLVHGHIRDAHLDIPRRGPATGRNLIGELSTADET